MRDGGFEIYLQYLGDWREGIGAGFWVLFSPWFLWHE